MINTGPKDQYVERGRPESSLRPKKTDLEGHYAHKGLLDDKCRPEGPIRSEGTGPKGHYIKKEQIQRATTSEKVRSEGSLRSERAIR
jgi:hypothetical protein